MAHLHKAGAERKVERTNEAEAYQRPAPYAVVEECDDFIHGIRVLFQAAKIQLFCQTATFLCEKYF